MNKPATDVYEIMSETPETAIDPDVLSVESNYQDDMDMVLSLFNEDTVQIECTESETAIIKQGAVSMIESNENKTEVKLTPRIKQKNAEVMIETQSKVSANNIDVKVNLDVDTQNFIQWIMSGKLLMNQNNVRLHFVENHLFMVTPNIFQLYCAEVIGNTEKATWERLQKQFQNLGIHKRQYTDNGDSRNIWTCKVAGPNRTSRVYGYLIEHTIMFVGDKLVINNQWLTLEGKIQ